MNIADTLKMKPVILPLKQTLLQTYIKTNQSDSAIIILQETWKLQQNILDDKVTKSITDAETKYQTTQKELENTQLKAEKAEEKQAKQQQLFSFLALVVVLVGLGAFLVYRNRQKAKQAAVLAGLNSALSQTNKELGLAQNQLKVLLESQNHDHTNLFQILQGLGRQIEQSQILTQSQELGRQLIKITGAVSEMDTILYGDLKQLQIIEQDFDIEAEKNKYRTPAQIIEKIKVFLQNFSSLLPRTYPLGGAESPEGLQVLQIITEIDEASQQITLNASEKTAFGVIILETVRNALKYAFQDFACDQPTIRISLVFVETYTENYKTTNVYELQVADNGKGLPSIEAYRQGSKGLQLIQDFAKQLGNLPQISTETGKGTKYVFRIER